MPRTDLKPEPGANPPPSSSSDSSRPAAASSSALLDLISGHLTPTMSSSGKDPITCHVLDTTAGRPAKGIRVRLEGPSFASPASNNHTSSSAIASPSEGNNAAGGLKSFEAFTDDDGRVKVWLPYSSETSAGEVPVHTLVDVLANVRGPSRWTLRFDTEGYFGEAATFFPEATVVFRVDEGQHYHVPLLLSPYSYTTYRGS